MFEDKNKAAEVKRGFTHKLCDALCQRNDVARNELADADADRLKRATCFVVAIFPVISLIAFLASCVHKVVAELLGFFAGRNLLEMDSTMQSRTASATQSR
ncbi:hypothetical protein AAVH_22839 [Aphelenchoides avenae]|nr:hypothetical protein AAVH_22839 [Aphelenchus avenae]